MKYYLTTPIYYVNAAPHIGHAYTTLAADTIKRLKTMQGYTTVLTTGTDEHGEKVERSAVAMGKTPEEFATIISNEFRAEWDKLGIRYDHFIRTTDPKHYETVRFLFQLCKDKGYIYKGSYTGQYCVSDEAYVNDAKPGDNCPTCGRPTETVTEENYFFKLSAFTDRLLKHYEDNPDFIQPESRRNEVTSFVRGGLQDLSISRTTVKWGIPLDGEHVVYVWFDALTNYISAVGGLPLNDEGKEFWPADLHLVGKEILRFHGVFWPAFLMAAELPLPKKIFAHGWLLFENDKMSKSRGNIVRAEPIREVMGTEALRYFLFREIVFGQDGGFSYDALVGRYNAELANGLGNLASRTLTMIRQYRDGVIPANAAYPLDEAVTRAIGEAVRAFDALEFSRGLEGIWVMLSAADKFIVEQAPWKLSKAGDGAKQQLDDALYASADLLRVAITLLHPILPESTTQIWAQLGMTTPLEKFDIRTLKYGQLAVGQAIGMVSPVFPRIDAKSAIDRMRELEEIETARQAKLLGKTAQPPATAAVPVDPPSPKIEFDDFAKIDLRVGIVLSAEPVKGADKLLHLKVDIGEPEPRTIVAGIAKAYEAEKLVGRKVVIVANLNPRKLRGIESNGMIVAASLEGGKPILAGFLEDVPVGARLK